MFRSFLLSFSSKFLLSRGDSTGAAPLVDASCAAVTTEELQKFSFKQNFWVLTLAVNTKHVEHLCKCGQLARPTQRNCWRCHAVYMRNYKKKHPPSSIQRLKTNARRYVKVYIERGIVQRGLCETCNSPDTQAHHEDYSQPLAVRWFCRAHHLQHEGKVVRKSKIERWVVKADDDKPPSGAPPAGS